MEARRGKDKRGKRDKKTRKSKSEEKVVSFRSASLFLARKREALTKVETTGIDQPTRTITQGTDIVKGGRTSKTTGAFRIHSRKTIITRARAL